MLSFHDRMLEEEDLTEFLVSPKAQHLLELDIGSSKINNRLAKLLITSKTEEIVLSELGVLSLRECDTPAEVFFAIAASRLPILKTMEISQCSDMLISCDLPCLERMISFVPTSV
ncbi:hypothetical protein Hypma_008589 [Hypsizygus marmoreus]|uniref:Uncharacterized protein n=1 Tax=Hypsizygus marmoreus TaxID=39966 RepID=A0A369JPA2_HYPMA|nr:hypothetical protein Hypma_008589 [Hypsizygus marmoreus]